MIAFGVVSDMHMYSPIYIFDHYEMFVMSLCSKT